MGPKPRYVQSVPSGLSGWSPSALAIGRHLVEISTHAMSHDPIKTVEELAAETGLGLDDARVGVLDLKEAGFLWEGRLPGHVAADCALFAEFDEAYMPFSPAEDARTLANKLVMLDDRAVYTASLAKELEWEPRRINSAICYLIRAGAIETRTALASAPWRAVHLIRTDRTLRFARNNG